MKTVQVDTTRLWLSNKEAMKYLGVSKDWLDKRRKEGRLHYSKVANTIFYIKSEIDRMIKDNAVSGVDKFRKIT